MGILDIINRVVVALAFGQLQVKIELAVRAAHQEEEPGHILPDLVLPGDSQSIADHLTHLPDDESSPSLAQTSW